MIKTTEIAAADFDVASHIILFASIYKKKYTSFEQKLNLNSGGIEPL